MTRVRSVTVGSSVLGLALGVLAVHAFHYYPYLSDDALISLRYSKRLIDGLGLTWTDGVRVEGYTNFLWVLLNAGLGSLGVDLITGARALCSVGAACCVFLVSVDPTRPFRPDPIRSMTAGLLLALTAPLAVWAIGGLEQSVMAAVLASGLLLLYRGLESQRVWSGDFLAAASCFAALGLLRADGIVLFAFAMAGVALSHGLNRLTFQRILCCSCVVAVPLAGHLLFRIVYYGELVPNTARVKVSLSAPHVKHGFEYVTEGFSTAIVLCVIAGAALVYAYRHLPRHRLLVPASVALGWSLYLITVGGDRAFAGWRQLLLALVPLVMIVSEGAAVIRPRLGRRPKLALVLALGAACVVHLHWQSQNQVNLRAKSERWEWGGLAIGKVLQKEFGSQQPLVAVDAAGSLPYWSELPALDMLGINDKYLATHRPADFGTGPPAHELGDGTYVWNRKPDILAFNSGAGDERPMWRAGKELMARSDFRDVYQPVRIRGSLDRAYLPKSWLGTLYVRRESPIGIRRSGVEVRIPAYLLSQTLTEGARLNASGELVAPVGSAMPGILDRVRLQRGTWEIRVEPDDPDLQFAVVCFGASAEPAGIAGPPALFLPTDGSIDLVVGLPVGQPDTALLREVRLTRTTRASATLRCMAADRPISVPLARLSSPKPDGTFWAHPGNLVIGRAGLKVSLTSPMPTRWLELSADADDAYKLAFVRGGQPIASVDIAPVAGRQGLQLRRVSVPAAAIEGGADSLYLRPTSGPRNSIGHMRFTAGS